MQVDAFHATALGRGVSNAVCGDRMSACRAVENENRRLKYEVLTLQKEVSDRAKEATRLKGTITQLTEKLGAAGTRIKQLSSASE